MICSPVERKTPRVDSAFSKTGKSQTVPRGPRLQAVLEEALSCRGEAPVVFVTKAGGAPDSRWVYNGPKIP